VVGPQNAHIVDTLHVRDVATATTFWLSMGYNFGCMIARARRCSCNNVVQLINATERCDNVLLVVTQI